jgi:hypothetical protein
LVGVFEVRYATTHNTLVAATCDCWDLLTM